MYIYFKYILNVYIFLNAYGFLKKKIAKKRWLTKLGSVLDKHTLLLNSTCQTYRKVISVEKILSTATEGSKLTLHSNCSRLTSSARAGSKPGTQRTPKLLSCPRSCRNHFMPFPWRGPLARWCHGRFSPSIPQKPVLSGHNTLRTCFSPRPWARVGKQPWSYTTSCWLVKGKKKVCEGNAASLPQPALSCEHCREQWRAQVPPGPRLALSTTKELKSVTYANRFAINGGTTRALGGEWPTEPRPG